MWVGDEILYRALHISHTHLCLADGKVWSVVVLVSSIKLVTMRVIPLRELVLSKTEAAQAVPAESLLRAKGLGMPRAWRKNLPLSFQLLSPVGQRWIGAPRPSWPGCGR